MALSRREFIGGLAVTFASALARRLSAQAPAPEFPEGVYVFEALDAESGDVLVKRKTLQDFYTCSEKKAMEEGGRCKFAVADLPAGKSIKFRVTPRNAAGKGGRSLVSEAFRVPARENV